MAQFTCEICSKGFEQKSAYERHMVTSHPRRAPSAADVEKAIKGIDFPQTKAGLIDAASENSDPKVMDVLQQLPDRKYRDGAEVARALGELRSHQPKPQHQPSKKGGARARESMSAVRLTSLFSGVDFPASEAELKEYAKETADKEEKAIVDELRRGTYRDMSEVAKEVGNVMRSGG